jgi:hypothetical protein
LGNIHPLLAIALATIVGGISLTFLQTRGWFEIFTLRHGLGGSVTAATCATLLVIPAILVDLSLGYPRDMNVPLPQSWLFYPAIAYVVEIFLHALPLAVLLPLLNPLFEKAFEKANTDRLIWSGIFITAAVEPLLQLYWGLVGQPFSWAAVYTGPHLLAFNLVQLSVFKRYDFTSMLALRLIYYLYWHIIWGYWRLQWLF